VPKVKTRRKLSYTTMKEIRAVKSAAAAMRIIDQYGEAESDFLLEVSYIMVEVSDKLPPEEFVKFTDRCLVEHGVLFRSLEHLKVMLEVGRGNLPDKSLKVAMMRGIGASYLNMLRVKQNQGGITRVKIDKAIDKALEIADPRPLSDALGFTRPKLPLNRTRKTVPFVADAELDDKGVVWAIMSTGTRYRVTRGTVIKKIQQLLRTKASKKRKR